MQIIRMSIVMELLELIAEILFFPSSSDKNKHGRKHPSAQWFLVTFLIVGIIWTILEIQELKNFESPYIFASILFILSALVAFFIMYALFTLQIFFADNKTDFFVLLLCLMLNFAALTCFLNRQTGYPLMKIKPEIAIKS